MNAPVRPLVQLREGDCLDVLQQIPDQSVDMVFADPPYGSTVCAWDSHIDLSKLWPELKRICSGAIVLFAQAPFDKVLGASNLAMLKYEWIWEKSAATGHLNAKKAPMKAHENVLVFYDRLPTYNPIMTQGHLIKRSKKAAPKSKIYGGESGAHLYESTERYPRSVLYFAKDNRLGGWHPSQKPVALCEYLIRTYTNRGDTVLDFCMGSGSAGIAAKTHGRAFIGIEKDAAFFRMARARIEGHFL